MKPSTKTLIQSTAVGDFTLDMLRKEVERKQAELMGYGPPPKQVIYCSASQAELLKKLGLGHD